MIQPPDHRPIQPLTEVQAAASTTPTAPHYYSEIRAPRAAAGVYVNEQTALTFAAVFGAIRAISEDLAGLGVKTRRQLPGGGREDLPDHPATRMLTWPNMDMTGYTLRETLQAHALSWGNGYAEIERNARGRPVALHLLTPDRVNPRREDGMIVYQVSNPGGGADTWLAARDMFHLHGLGYDGLVGYSVINMAARTIGMGIAADEYGASTFSNRSVPSGVLKYPKRLDDDGRVNLRESWEHLFKGPKNASRVAILEEGLEYEGLGLPPEDVQFIQNRQFQIEEVARWYRIPPHKLQHIVKATFNNIEEQNIGYVQDALLPWTHRMEAEAERKLLAPGERGAVRVKLNLNTLLRGAIEKRTEAYVKGRQWGWLSANDVRGWEDLDPLPAEIGDIYLVPMNMTTPDRIGEDPAPARAPAAAEAGEPGSDEPMAHLRPAIADAIRRCYMREYHHAGRAPAGLVSAQEFAGWSRTFNASHGDYCQRALAPICESAMLAVLPAPPAALEALLAAFIEDMTQDSRELVQGAWADASLDALQPALDAGIMQYTDKLIDQLVAMATLNSEAHP